MRCDQYFFSRYRQPMNLASNFPILHSHSINISRIIHLKAGGGRAANTAQSRYWLCYNMIRTQILNWSQSSKNCKVGTVVRLQPRQKPMVLSLVWVTTHHDNGGQAFWTGPETNRTEPIFQSIHGLLVGYLDPFLTLDLITLQSCSLQNQRSLTLL
jgi:hypothetical protein